MALLSGVKFESMLGLPCGHSASSAVSVAEIQPHILFAVSLWGLVQHSTQLLHKTIIKIDYCFIFNKLSRSYTIEFRANADKSFLRRCQIQSGQRLCFSIVFPAGLKICYYTVTLLNCIYECKYKPSEMDNHKKQNILIFMTHSGNYRGCIIILLWRNIVLHHFPKIMSEMQIRNTVSK